MCTRLVLASVLLSFSLAAGGAEPLSAEALLPGHGATDAHAPVAAFGNDVFLVVWRAGMGEKADIVGLRLDKTGKVLDAKPFVISGAKDCQERPRIAFGGGNFLVVWQDLRNEKDYDVFAARVSPEGAVLDADGIAVSAEKENQCQPAVCFDGSAFQLLWRDFRNNNDYDLYGGRVGPNGRKLNSPGVLVQKRRRMTYTTMMGVPGVGANAKGDVVAGAYLGGVHVWRMRDGKSLGETKVARKARDHGSSWNPAFASDGEKFLMVFTTYRPVSRGGRASGTGAVLLNAALSAAGGENAIALSSQKLWASAVRNPSPAWDGKTYVVAWDRGTSMAVRAKPHDAVFLRRISQDGKGIGEDTPVAGNRGSPALHPAVASDGVGTTLVAYEKHPSKGDVPIKIAFRMLRAK